MRPQCYLLPDRGKDTKIKTKTARAASNALWNETLSWPLAAVWAFPYFKSFINVLTCFTPLLPF